MSSIDNEIQPLEGPFKHHLYIGLSEKDFKDVSRLRTQLQRKGLICCLRSFKDDIKISIQDGIRTSQKCLIFLTSDYLKDKWYKVEVEALLEKVAQFCRDSLIIMKKSESSDVPPKLCGFKHILFRPDKIEDEKANAELVDIITSGTVVVKLSFTFIFQNFSPYTLNIFCSIIQTLNFFITIIKIALSIT